MDKYSKLFHIQKDRKGGIIPLIPVYDNEGKLHCFFEKGNDIIEFQPIKLIIGDYFAKKRNSDKDIYFNFIDFMYQRSVTIDIFPILESIRDDVHNLSASLKKLEVFFFLREDECIDIQRFVSTEIEYIFIVCRSFFDRFQFIAKKLWNTIELKDKNIKKKELQDSFSDMSKIGTSEELQKNMGFRLSGQHFIFRKHSFLKR